MFKSNKRRILSIFIMVLALIVLVPSFALSYFYFNTPSINDPTNIDNGSVNGNNGIDDIKENYTGNKDDSSKEYTIYFFPSVLYTQYYLNQLTNSTTLGITPLDGVNPEDWFGYNELTYNEDTDGFTSNIYFNGTNYLYNNVATDRMGDLGYINFITDTYDKHRDSEIVEGTHNGETRKVIEAEHIDKNPDKFSIKSQDYNLLSQTYLPFSEGDFESGIASNGMDDYRYSWDAYNRDFGDPLDVVEKQYFDSSFLFENGGDYENMPKLDGQFNYDNIYKMDRFGFWPNNRVNIEPNKDFKLIKHYENVKYRYEGIIFHPTYEGPVTVEITQHFSVNQNQVADLNLGRYLPYKLKVDDYLPIDWYENLIDFPESDMGDINKYGSDHNNAPNPFYNYSFAGWGYFNEKNEFSVALNAGDNVIEKVFTSENISNTFDIMSNLEQYADDNGVIRLFPIFSNGKKYSTNPGSTANDQYAFRLNFNDKPTSESVSYEYNIDNYFLRNGTSQNSSISLTRIGNFRYDVSYNGTSKYINVEVTTANNYILSDDTWEISMYGRNFEKVLRTNYGLYNIYIFAYNGQDANVLNEANIERTIRDFYPTKNLGNIHYNIDEVNTYGDSLKYIIGYERISDVKFIEGLNEGAPFDSQISEDKYNNSQSMLKQSNKVFLANDVIDNDSCFTIGEGIEAGHKVISDFNFSKITYDLYSTPINNDNIYLIKNIDFTNYSSLDESIFQIKLNINSNTSEQFAFSDPYADGSSNTVIKFKNEKFDALIYNPSGDLTDENVFIPASYYFEQVTDNLGGYGYKPRHTVYLGMYDFILYFGGSNYELYCYRHSNMTVSIYSKDQQDNDRDGYVDPIQNELIWSRKTFIGSYLEDSNSGNVGSIVGQTLKDTINGYLINNGADKSKPYYIRDHVTGLDLFRFTFNNETNSWDVQKLLNDFRIRKNYVFYITNEEPLVNQSSGN